MFCSYYRLLTSGSTIATMTTPNAQDNVPGTEYLVDTNHSLDVSHAGSGSSDIVLLPQPTGCGRDPLVICYCNPIHTTLLTLTFHTTALVHVEEVLAVDHPCFIRLWLLIRRKQSWCCAYRHQPRGSCAFDCFGGRWSVELFTFGEWARFSIFFRKSCQKLSQQTTMLTFRLVLRVSQTYSGYPLR